MQAFGVDAIFGRALAALQAGQPQEAALTLQDALSDAVHNRGYGELQQLAQMAAGLLPGDAWLGCAGLYAAALADHAQPAALLAQARAWLESTRASFVESAQVTNEPVRAEPVEAFRQAQGERVYRFNKSCNTKPKLAYLVSQPHHHQLLSAVIAAHDTSAVEVHVFADQAWPGLPGHVKRHALNAANLAATCQANQIDVVVDTGGLQPFAGQYAVIEQLLRRIAPVQVGWLGCLASSGGVFDVLLADDVSVPPGAEAHFSEQVVRLAGGQWCWTPPSSAPAVTAAPCLTRGHVTVGVVGRSLRLGPQFLSTLTQVMAGEPTLRVCFIGKVCGDEAQRANIVAMLAARGVTTDRLSFAPWDTREGYWHWLATVDVVLDTCPASGGLSLLDALWMGVPVVTCVGATMGSRQAASVLTAMGIGQWIAKNSTDLTRLTLALLQCKSELHASRLAMRGRFQQSPLLSGQRIALQIEAMVRT
ncbi:MAG: hypothetical protein EAZ37_09140 [Burkholderiales bacterium]|nr:MAG: hypothetical protein EAZ37_09140 [Burkholderiales bacterium]